MSRTNSQAKIIYEEQLVPRAKRLVIKKNNQCVASDSHIIDTMLRFVVEILRHHKLYNPVSLTTTIPIIYLHKFWTTINHNKNNHTFTFELDNHTFTLTPGVLKTILQISDSKLHSSQDDHPITKLLNTTNGDYKFRIKVPDAMISNAIKKKAGYKYYMAKKVESEKARTIDGPKEQHVSPVKSGRGKGFICYGDQV
ncbi:hypothetical protein Tco_1011165 [Tanacetum coccineum]